jgi:hypothetical protein
MLVFTGFQSLKVALVLLIAMLDTSSDRARRTASNNVAFESGTSGESNIFKKFFLKKFPMVLHYHMQFLLLKRNKTEGGKAYIFKNTRRLSIMTIKEEIFKKVVLIRYSAFD